MRFAPTSYRPLFGRVLSVLSIAIVAFGLVGLVLAGDWVPLLRFSAPAAFAVVLVLATFWRPRIDVAEHGVTVVNVFSTVQVPWPAIERVDTKYALTLYTVGGKVSAWASPAPGRFSTQLGTRGDARLAARDGESAVRPGDLPHTASGALALVIRDHWQQLRDDGLLELGVDREAMRREPHRATAIALAVLAAASLAAVLL